MTPSMNEGGTIPSEVIDQVRDRADLIQIMGERVSLKKAGSSFKCLCPFHDDHNPSMVVSPAKQLYHCFSCGASGNVFTFVMEMNGLSFPEAVRHLAERVGVVIPETKEGRDPKRKERLERLADLNAFAARFFQDRLFSEEGRAARAYLARRGFEEKSARHFRLGLAPDEWEGLLTTARGKFAAEDLEASGLFVHSEKKGGLYDRFRGRLIFPITDLRGRTIGFGGRILSEEKDQPKYLNSPETPLFQKGRNLYGLLEGRESLRRADSVLMVEGYTDVVLCHQAGFENAVAALGTAMTEEQARLLRRFVEEIHFLYDPDPAGRAAAERGIGLALAQGLRVKVVRLPDGEDPADFIAKHGAAAFRERIEGAADFLDYFIEEAEAGKELDSAEGRTRTARRILEVLAKMRDPIRRDAHLGAAADRLGIEKGLLLRELGRSERSAGELPRAGGEKSARPVQQETELDAELSLLKLLLELPWEERGAAAVLVRRYMEAEDFSKETRAKLYTALLEAEGPEEARGAVLMDRLGGEAADLIAFLGTNEMPIKDPARLARDLIRAVKRRRMEGSVASIKRRMNSAGAEESRELTRQFMDIQKKWQIIEKELRSS